ncbi:RPA-related protein RADX isoform X4 [Oryzias melastigma]|uniref:RPA-related protein RADX isoform X4 n=1 Tax=Oryzias melastigma TaxID=30732 RepID=UPI000CF7C846|nr:RPA-related protein RADX isoform X4 [Oryzias melastigma]
MEDSQSSSSLVLPPPQASFLQRTLERLSSTQCLRFGCDQGEAVAVVALQRYLSERADGPDELLHNYSYDVTLTDGVWRVKCFLHASLSNLVHTNTLRTGMDIFISQCCFVFSERMLGHGYICIEKLRCGAGSSAVLPNINDVSLLPMLVRHGMERSVLLHKDVPLQVSRKHYLPLWNNDDPEGDMWISGASSSDAVLDVSKMMLISTLESSFGHTLNYLPLLVKIIHKSRLRYYGKFGVKKDCPYLAYFEVADQSGTMSLVLWDELCPEFYERLNVGTVLYLQNYKLKQSYAKRSRPQMDHYRMKHCNSVEISLNPRDPSSIFTVVSPKSVQPQWGLPDVSYRFTSRSELDKLADNFACDIIGLVTFVGRVERVRSKALERYWTYRWVHAVDGTSDHPFILELFSSSQPEIFNNICPMTYLVCTQMRVCNVTGSQPYLTSSCETEMFITGYHKGQPYVSDPRVKNFIQWTKTLKDNAVLQKTAVGGHYSYPHSPPMFVQSAAGQVPLIAAADLKRELETLQYREHKRHAFQGQITAVQYLRSPKTSGVEETEQVSENDDADSHSSPSQRLPSPSSAGTSATSRKRKIQMRLGCKKTNEKEQEEEEANSASEVQLQEHSCGHNPGQAVSSALSWEGSSWPKQHQELTEHLCQGGLHQDSIRRRFTFDEKNVLLQWSNLQPSRWTSKQSTEPVPPALCSGYYQLTILGINKQIAVDAAFLPVVSSNDPQAVSLPQGLHDNTMLSCLSSGFLCPLTGTDDSEERSLPEPEEILETATELEDMHVVCILDLCHLGEDKLEVLINKVYKVTEVSLD